MERPDAMPQSLERPGDGLGVRRPVVPRSSAVGARSAEEGPLEEGGRRDPQPFGQRRAGPRNLE